MSQNLRVTGAAVLEIVVLVVVFLVLGAILLWIRKRGEAKNKVDGGGHIRAQESGSPAGSPVADPSDSLPESPTETSEEHGPSDI